MWSRVISLALLVTLMACATPAGSPTPQPPAEAVRLTIYSDGAGCPGGCDAHVVFQPRHDGTRNAFAPGRTLLEHRADATGHPCGGSDRPDGGRPCVICFDDRDASCLLVTHRGAGPPAGRFDVTPAFLAQHCATPSLPDALRETCASYQQAVERLAARINCIVEPARAECAQLMTAAEAARALDAPRLAACRAAGGPAAYNATEPDPALHRTHGCSYFANQRNAAGLRLAPGACPAGSYVGRDGYDCCPGDPALAAIDPVECGIYFVEPG